jgi:hypothetical protein
MTCYDLVILIRSGRGEIVALLTIDRCFCCKPLFCDIGDGDLRF